MPIMTPAASGVLVGGMVLRLPRSMPNRLALISIGKKDGRTVWVRSEPRRARREQIKSSVVNMACVSAVDR